MNLAGALKESLELGSDVLLTMNSVARPKPCHPHNAEGEH
jgi:hypothetical protein